MPPRKIIILRFSCRVQYWTLDLTENTEDWLPYISPHLILQRKKKAGFLES